MSFEWLGNQSYAFAGGGIVVAALAHPTSGTRWRKDSMRLVFQGSYQINDEDPVTFYHDTNYPWRRFLTDQPDALLQDMECSSCEFRFPEDPTFEDHGITLRRRALSHDARQPTVLPPSGPVGHGCVVSYCVQAEVHDDGSGSIFTATLPLDFQMVREHLDAEATTRAILQVKRVKTTATYPASKPMGLQLTHPVAFAPERGFSLGLRRTADTDMLNADQPLELVAISMFIHEHIKASTRSDSSYRYTHKHTIVDDILENTHKPSITTNGLDIAGCKSPLRFPDDLTPSFELPDLKRYYSLEVQVKTMFEGMATQFDFQCGGVRVLPGWLSCLAHAQTEDDSWETEGSGEPFPDAVKREKARLGI